MKVSTRINGRVTSINVRDSVCAIHHIICGDPGGKKVEDHVLDTCHDIIDTWEGDTARGLSGYITDSMLKSMLDPEDMQLFNQTLKRLRNA